MTRSHFAARAARRSQGLVTCVQRTSIPARASASRITSRPSAESSTNSTSSGLAISAIGPGRLTARSLTTQRKAHHEDAALAREVGDLDASVMRFDRILCDCEAQSEPAPIGAALDERREQLLDLSRRQSPALVLH